MMSEPKLKATKGTRFKILTPKQMIQRLPIANAQYKIRQIAYSLHQ